MVARRRVPRAVFDYVEGGADRELSMLRSRQALDRVEFLPSVLRDVSNVQTSSPVLGEETAMPLVLAPTGFTRMMHHNGEPAVARAADRLGIPYALSTMGTTSIEDLAVAAPGGRRWFQLYLWRDREASWEFIRRAAQQGYECLVLTVDTPVGGPRLRDVRNGMTIPPSLTARAIIDGARHTSWWINFLTTEPLEFASLNSFSGTVADLASQVFDPTASTSDLQWLRDEWQGKLVIKGIQTPEDAVMAVDAGADGIVVSNHGGRQLDRSPTPLEQLPAIASSVGDRSEVFVDGGILSGSDIVAAVGLGAKAALVGRAYLYGLMAGGEAGVDRTLELLRQEMVMTMKLMGVTSVDELRKGRVRLR